MFASVLWALNLRPPRPGRGVKTLPSSKSQKQGGPGSVRFGCGLVVEGFERFRFSVLAVPLQKGFFCVSVQFNREGWFRFRFGFLGKRFRRFHFRFRELKTVPTVPASGSGSVPEPSCKKEPPKRVKNESPGDFASQKSPVF